MTNGVPAGLLRLRYQKKKTKEVESDMDIRSRSITADILNVISDGKIHTMQEIADEVECSRRTVIRHIQSLSYRFPIETFCGGDARGGVLLDRKYIVNGKIISNEKLNIINQALEMYKANQTGSSNENLINELLKDFAAPQKKETK